MASGWLFSGPGRAAPVAALALALLGATACLPPVPRAEDGATTGVRGTVRKGPMCPGPVRVGHPCPDRPVEAGFEVRDAAGRRVATFRSDAEGRFEVALPAGEYTLVPDEAARAQNPGAAPAPVAVVAGAVTEVTLYWDTGMR